MDRLNSGLESLGIVLDDKQLAQFERYLSLLLEWNQKFNLTAVREADLIQERHFLDSLTCVLATDDLNGCTMIDVGSGAGFPGLPLKICFPELQLTLIESVQKKTRFLQAVVEGLRLTEVSIFSSRAEELGQSPDHRQAYDWAVARAVSPLRVLTEYLIPFTRVGGYTIAQKGAGAVDEVLEAEHAISLLGGGSAALIPVTKFGVGQPSYLVKIEKVTATPDQFPRRTGIPAKRPL